MDTQAIVALGKEIGYTGIALIEFVEEREEKELEREKERIARDERQLERDEKRRQEQIVRDREERDHQYRMEQLRLTAGANIVDTSRVKASAPKLPAFDENNDDMDSYLYRFEKFAESQGWPKPGWATSLSALLSGKALTVYASMMINDAMDYDKLKESLLKRYQLNEEGLRVKFRNSRLEGHETATAFAGRLEHYFDRWTALAKVENKYEKLKDMLVREQFLSCCDKDLSLFLREREIANINDMTEYADRFREAREQVGPKEQVKSQKNTFQGQKFVSAKSNAVGRQTGSQEIDTTRRTGIKRCFSCGKTGHISVNCWSKSRVASGTRGPHKVASLVQVEQDNKPNRGTDTIQVATCTQVIEPCCEEGGCLNLDGKSNVELRCGHILPVISMTSLAANRNHIDNMPVVKGEVNGRQVNVLRDSGCNGVVIRKGLVKHNQMTGEVRTYIMIDRTCRKAPIARIEVDTPFYVGEVEAMCMETPVYDLVLGNVDGVRKPSDPDLNWHKLHANLKVDKAKESECIPSSVDSTITKESACIPSGADITVSVTKEFECIPSNVGTDPEVTNESMCSFKHNMEATKKSECISNVVDQVLNDDAEIAAQGEAVVDKCERFVVQTVQTMAQRIAQGKPVKKLVVPELSKGTSKEPITVEVLKEAQQTDQTLERVRKLAMTNEEVNTGRENKARFFIKKGLVYLECTSPRVELGKVFTQLVVPQKLRNEVMSLAHESIVGGHLGAKKTYDKIAAQFYWPGIYSEVVRYCRSCDICQKTISKGRVTKVPLGTMPLIDVPFQKVAVDLVGPIEPVTDRGNRYILTLMDYATRYPEAVVLKRIQAEVVAEALVSIYSRVGIPQEILTDLGTLFVADIMKEVNRLLSIKHLTTTPYHPACNGLVERFNGVLKSMLKKMCAERPKDWDRYVDPVLFAYREVPQESMGFSPFELLYGRTVRGPMTILSELWTKDIAIPEVKSTYQYVLDLRQRLEETCKLAMTELGKSQVRYKKYYDHKSKARKFKVDDKVLILLPTNYNKLLMQWQGPYKVKEVVGEMDYRIYVKGKVKIYHANLLKKYEERKVPTDREEATNQSDHSDIATMTGIMNCVATAVIESSDEDERDASLIELVQTVPTEMTESVENVKVSDKLHDIQQRELREVLREYSDVLTDIPGQSKLGEHDIKLTTNDPVKSRPYPLPFAMRDTIKHEVESMLHIGVIEPSFSPYASPIVIVKKKDGSNRFCIDFRKLNKITIFDAEPMPNPED
ncbi:uncharacterized protein LOC144442090 [Glandiceps talaboti]